MDISDIKKGINPSGLDPTIEKEAIKAAKWSWQDIIVVLKAINNVEHIDELDEDMLLQAEDALISHKYMVLERSGEKKARGRRL